MSELKLVLIILNREEHLEELLQSFVELDIRGATVIDSVGMGQVISDAAPIFGGIGSLMTGSRPYNKTILTVVPVGKVSDIVHSFEQICGSLDEPGTGLIFTLPIDYVKGLPETALTWNKP